jgi:galactokinase
VRHALAGGEYNQRRAECEEGARFFAERLPGAKALRDVSLADLEKYGAKLPEIIRRRSRHVISENLRVRQAADAFEKGDLELVGRLMADSHASLRDDFAVSCSELDVMVDLAGEVEGVYGARMTGGGFGGCTVNLVREEDVAEFQRRVAAGYREKTGYAAEIYVSMAADGVSRVA